MTSHKTDSELGIEHRFGGVDGVKIHYMIAGEGDPVLLIHGYPETSHQWRKVIPALAKRYTVIAPDYRGAGESDRPPTGYDKVTVMEDLRAVVKGLGFDRVSVVGHDMGAVVSYAYAASHPDEVTNLGILDTVIPGTPQFAQLRAGGRSWHINFQAFADLPEVLVAGREREYLTSFYTTRFTIPRGISQEDMEVYIRAYSAPGGMRSAFQLYREILNNDIAVYEKFFQSKLLMPVLVLAGDASASGPFLKEMATEFFANSTYKVVRGAGHWLTDEYPEEVAEYLLAFLGASNQ